MVRRDLHLDVHSGGGSEELVGSLQALACAIATLLLLLSICCKSGEIGCQQASSCMFFSPLQLYFKQHCTCTIRFLIIQGSSKKYHCT
jgi:hypothetical protein